MSIRALRHVAAPLLLGMSGAVLAAAPDASIRNFVACPILRDTASVPCWLAEYDGELYFLVVQADVSAPVNPPWLGHRVLVEGTRSDEPRICGGIVLKPVKLSVMPERDGSCDQVWPAEDRYNLTFEPPRPPGPSKGRLAFDYLDPPPPPSPTAQGKRSFTIHYDFDGLVSFRHAAEITPALEYAQAIKASRIAVEGQRGAALLSDGTVMQERKNVGEQRAVQMGELLRGAGLTAPRYDVTWRDTKQRPDGRNDAAERIVTVTVLP